MIPDFSASGNLPPGIHAATWDEFKNKFGQSTHRQFLIDGLRDALSILSQCKCDLAYIDGSFVTEKNAPNDYDMCWSLTNVDSKLLQSIGKDLIDFSKNGRATMKAKYKGDIFPAETPEGKSGKRFLEFFQEDKNTGEAKGIIQLTPGDCND